MMNTNDDPVLAWIMDAKNSSVIERVSYHHWMLGAAIQRLKFNKQHEEAIKYAFAQLTPDERNAVAELALRVPAEVYGFAADLRKLILPGTRH
jgi:hypothetical protein